MLEFIEKPIEIKPLLLAKISTECTHGLCADFQKIFYKVSNIIKKQNRALVVNCFSEPNACNLFPRG